MPHPPGQVVIHGSRKHGGLRPRNLEGGSGRVMIPDAAADCVLCPTLDLLPVLISR